MSKICAVEMCMEVPKKQHHICAHHEYLFNRARTSSLCSEPGCMWEVFSDGPYGNTCGRHGEPPLEELRLPTCGVESCDMQLSSHDPYRGFCYMHRYKSMTAEEIGKEHFLRDKEEYERKVKQEDVDAKKRLKDCEQELESLQRHIVSELPKRGVARLKETIKVYEVQFSDGSTVEYTEREK